MIKQTLLFTVILFSLTTKAFAWGDIGHRIVGEIATKYLSLETRVKLFRIMRHETLAQAATWPDEMRSEPKTYYFMSPWHYTEVLPGTSYTLEKANPKGDVIQAINYIKAHFTNGDTSKLLVEAQKKNILTDRDWIRLLAHFVGDIHQPLHVGNGLDRGGNRCLVKWFGETQKLHHVWDENLIESQKLSFTEYSAFLSRPDLITPAIRDEWSNSTVEDWAAESAKLRPGVYPKLPQDQGKVMKDAAGKVVIDSDGKALPRRSYCQVETDQDGRTIWKLPMDAEMIPNLKYKYRHIHIKTVNKRLQQAGVRLAAVLNSVLN